MFSDYVLGKDLRAAAGRADCRPCSPPRAAYTAVDFATVPEPSLLAFVARLRSATPRFRCSTFSSSSTGLARARGVLTRRPARRALDAVTGVALICFGVKLAVDSSRGPAAVGPVRPARRRTRLEAREGCVD
jgi:hypothetical protein